MINPREVASVVAEVVTRTYYTPACDPCLWVGIRGLSRSVAEAHAERHNRERHAEEVSR